MKKHLWVKTNRCDFFHRNALDDSRVRAHWTRIYNSEVSSEVEICSVICYFTVKHEGTTAIYWNITEVHGNIKLGPRDVWYIFVVRHVWMCQKRFVVSDTYSLLWCVNLPPNWRTRCDEWMNDTPTQIRHIFSYTRCANHDAWRITNTNHTSCGPSLMSVKMVCRWCRQFHDGQTRK